MDENDRPPADAGTLEEAREIIRRQAVELERLRRELDDARVLENLRQSVEITAAASEIANPVSHAGLLQMIVETAASVIDAEAGALFLVDESAGDLTFEVAIGPKADEVKRYRVPLGHGIAGLVALNGQPMAVSNAESDPRQASDIAQSVHYVPRSLLCVPLIADDRIIGVLELLNKRGEASFGAADLSALRLFARQAGVAVELSRTRSGLAKVVLEALGVSPVADGRAAHGGLAEDRALREAIATARLIREVSAYGEYERTLCHNLLATLADSFRQRVGIANGARPAR
jgi:GAF domain-containing protein